MRATPSGEADAGLIIHESRFTYAAAALACVIDLGDWWESATGNPIPLGAILARRDIDDETARDIDAAIRRSLAFARTREPEIIDYVRAHAFEMDDAIMRAHIALYVNDYSADVGASGISAVRDLFERAAAHGLIPPTAQPVFV